MRIELQLVEFERGTCAIIPVAAAPARLGLVNPLAISRFAISQAASGLENEDWGELTVEAENSPALCQNDTRLAQESRENSALPPVVHGVPVVFGEPVAYEVPIVFAN
ncbi:MAG: hypothetical protein N3J91_09635 [Verrucomicrobiae bacterium]|nr:hypothetical protein [Verrucomicrobiae bacterium]